MGGQMHQSNAALYDQMGTTSDAGDAVMARWLQSAGLQHLASPLASSGIDHRTLPNLLMQHVISEPFETSPFMPAVTRGFDSDFDSMIEKPQKGQADSSTKVTSIEKDNNAKENNIAKIKVVVDLTAYVEKHEFCFDAVLDEQVTNEEVYRVTVEPIIPTIFERTKATCFAYGQTGSGKTFTMQPLPLKACDDIVRLLRQPVYRSQNFRLWLSFFEIYGGKLFDLLNDRRKLCMREDGRQQVCIVGLQEFEVSDVQIVREYIEKGNAARSTGSTGANEESSRSHAILQLAIKRHASESKAGKVVGKISFIDLAGSERGADTTDNDRQTRIEGAEINKSLLALKECIRALDNDQIHIPFRGSKLTEVLRDSFVGNSRTVMISCISPNAGSCEHTLNTLRYADRVKSLSKGGSSKKEQSSSSVPAGKDSSSASSALLSSEADDFYDQSQDMKTVETGRKTAESFYNSNADADRYSSSLPPNYALNGREEGRMPSSSMDRDKPNVREAFGSSVASSKYYSSVNSDTLEEERVQKVSPTRRKVTREERPEKQSNWTRKDARADVSMSYKQHDQYDSNSNTTTSKQYDNDPINQDADINALLEEEEALISAHRKEIEDTMEVVREEMKLLAEVDQPGSLIENYVTQLSYVLSRKMAGLVGLQARLARFQHRLKEQEILSRKKVPR